MSNKQNVKYQLFNKLIFLKNEDNGGTYQFCNTADMPLIQLLDAGLDEDVLECPEKRLDAELRSDLIIIDNKPVSGIKIIKRFKDCDVSIAEDPRVDESRLTLIRLIRHTKSLINNKIFNKNDKTITIPCQYAHDDLGYIYLMDSKNKVII